jgi:thiol-disulfide isomerase/thioredoxin
MKVSRLLPAAAVLCAAALSAPAADLGLGSAAPKLEVKEFVKGEPVKAFEKGKTYVVEFWATWCGPCRTSIPHVTKLQKQYKDVVFIGVSIWEHDQSKVKDFVKEMGDKMDYRVATDAVPEGAKGDAGAMAKTWMDAAGQEGIPAAFIVNGEGKVAWIGHPTRLDKPLAQIVEGKYDLQAVVEEQKQEEALKELSAKLDEKLNAATEPKEMIALLDKAFAENAALEKQKYGLTKFRVLAEGLKDADKAAEYAKKLIDVLKDNPGQLNELAWLVVDPANKEKPAAKLLKVALEAAQKADALAKGEDAAIADTLGKAYFDNGQVEKAVETQERAVKLAKGNPEIEAELTKRLEEFKKALKK